MGLTRAQIARRKRVAIQKITREIGAKFHPEIHNPVEGSATLFFRVTKWVELVREDKLRVKLESKAVPYGN